MIQIIRLTIDQWAMMNQKDRDKFKLSPDKKLHLIDNGWVFVTILS